MKKGADGARDHHGDLLPELSASATRMDYQRLINSPLPEFDKEYPGSPFWMEFGYFLLRRTFNSMFRTCEVSGVENIPLDRGSMCSAWHTNGLIDPISIFLTHPKKFVVGGRHDLVTRPILGFWARKFAVQPVVRKAELLRGGCTEEEAVYLNGRSLLNLATGVAHGFGCALFPEGTSHSESHLIRVKTGPFRTVLAAAAHAKGKATNIPVIIPLGLHFRTRHFFRTDCWIEYGKPVDLADREFPDDLVNSISSGDWMEPPADLVTELRDEVEKQLAPLTPNRETWSEVHRDGVIAHMKERIANKSTLTWREEVLAVRKMKDEPESDDVQRLATKIGDSLNHAVLDARDINSNGDGLRGISPAGFVSNLFKLIPMLLLLPSIIIGLGPQITLGRLLGDRTDEGLDARTSYFFLFGMFGSLGWWPIMATVWSIVIFAFSSEIESEFGISAFELFGSSILSAVFSSIALWLSLVAIFWIGAISFANGWDAVSDSMRLIRRIKCSSSINPDLRNLRDMLD